MPKRACPHCARRLPYAGRRCLHCGWVTGVDAPLNGAASRWRRVRIWGVACVMLFAVATHFAYRNASALVDWYTGFAARLLPDSAAPSGTADGETGAYFYCARQVARKMPDQLSIETFDATAARTTPLGEGRYRVESAVDAAGERGTLVRHDFTCVARYDAGRWVLEDLRVAPNAPLAHARP